MNIGIYVRCSTVEQNTELQIRELKEYAAKRGWNECVVYEDKGLTGTNTNRPQLKRLLQDARERRIDLVLCWKLDRLARSLKDLIAILHEHGELGVAFVSLKDNIDMSTSAGRLMLHIIGAFAEFEAGIIRERVCAGLANARAKGTRLGRPPQIDLFQVQKLRDEGLSLKAISRRLGCSKSAVHKCLTENRAQNPSTKRKTTDVV